MNQCGCSNQNYDNFYSANNPINYMCQSTPACKTECPTAQSNTKVLGMAYVPWQHWKQTYECCQSLKKGTIFPELDKPFYGRRCDC